MARDQAKSVERLVELSEEFVDRHRRGERPAVEQYVQRDPSLAEELRVYLSVAQLVEDAAIAMRQAKLPASSRSH